MAFAQYDAKQVQVIVDGQSITGFADGTFVEIEFDEQQWNKVTGADGLTSRAKTNNNTGTVTVTLLATSSGNDILSSIWNKDRRSNTGVFNLLVKDSTGRTVWSSAQAWIQQMPTQSFSKEVDERAWVIDCVELAGQAGGNQSVA